MSNQNQNHEDALVKNTDMFVSRVERARGRLHEREVSRILSNRPRLRRLSTTATRH
ncbi:MAG: hypothetical protein ACK4NR_10020 [Micavibrio sp.]